ncbi:MAG: hypothetical protein A3K57_07625 [Caulobacterales bacterium RIFOXYA1_FULL_67_7]|jgi:hypothetical protein|nr:MAG: hypothetical protein A3K57_07625 [Caulobacterales bacterium RIFOXYA1_FULL_67_7]TAJ50725.1 MAG: hypothetical protein EPO54_04115 [Brevundimonas sp.]
MMRFSDVTRAAAGAEGPIWARSKKRKASAAPLVNLLVTLLALIGALTLVLSIKEGSVQAAGRMMDGWIMTGWTGAQRLAGRAPEAAEVAADKAGQATERTGDALKAGASTARDELKQ